MSRSTQNSRLARYKYDLYLITIYRHILLISIFIFISCGITVLILDWNKYTNCKSLIRPYIITSILSIIYNIKFPLIENNQTYKYYILSLFTLLFNIGLLIWGILQYTQLGCLKDNTSLKIYIIPLFIFQILITLITTYISYDIIYKHNNNMDRITDTTAYVIEIIIPHNGVSNLSNEIPVTVATPIQNV